jgi:hypothetical protein
MRLRTAFVFLGLLVPGLAWGFALEAPISLAPYGGGIQGSTGNVVALTPTSFLVATAGPDESEGTADDQILLVSEIGGVPQVTPFATPYLPTWSRITRLSATRAAVINAGPDATFDTADDGVHLLLGIGTTNTVTSVTTGFYDQQYDYAMPVPFGPDVVVTAADGPDGIYRTADDVLYVISNIGAGNTVTPVPAPFHGYEARASRLTPTSFLSMSYGPDGSGFTADDVTYLFTDLGGANTRSDIPTPYRADGRPGQGGRLSPTSAVLVGTGPDGSWPSADDEFLLLQDLGGGNTVTHIPAPHLTGWSPSAVLRISETRAVSASAGPDDTDQTADDQVLLLDDLGGANTVTPLTVGYLDDGPASRLHPLSPSVGALVSDGPDGTYNTTDDLIVIVRDLFGSNTILPVPMPGLSAFAGHKLTVLNPTSFLVANGGPDGDDNGTAADGQVAMVGGADAGTPFTLSLPSGEPANYYDLAQKPEILGGGRAAYSAAGPDHDYGTGGDDSIRVLSGLDLSDTLHVTKLTIKSTSKGEKASVKADLHIESGVLTLGDVDAVVSIGPAAEIIPADAFVNKGKKIEYKAPKGSGGLISKLTWKPEKGQLKIKAGGSGTGLEDTNPDHIPVAIELLSLSREEGRYLADGVAGTQSGSKIKYKAPKN